MSDNLEQSQKKEQIALKQEQLMEKICSLYIENPSSQDINNEPIYCRIYSILDALEYKANDN